MRTQMSPIFCTTIISTAKAKAMLKINSLLLILILA